MGGRRGGHEPENIGLIIAPPPLPIPSQGFPPPPHLTFPQVYTFRRARERENLNFIPHLLCVLSLSLSLHRNSAPPLRRKNGRSGREGERETVEVAVGKEEEEEKQTTEHLLLLPTPFISSPLRSASGKTGGRRGRGESGKFLGLPFSAPTATAVYYIFVSSSPYRCLFFAFSEVQVYFSPSLVSLATIFRSFLPTNQT